MEKEADVLSDPAYSRDALADANSFRTNSTRLTGGKNVTLCPLCKTKHDIEDCEEFLTKDIDQRHKVVFRQNLCFSCLEPVSDMHLAKTCTKKRKCRVCNASHPTTLHGGKGASAFHTSLERSVISMCVVPVQVWH